MSGPSTEKDIERKCSYCNAPEGELRVIGNFIVELKEVKIHENKKLVCQSCRVKIKEVRNAIQNNLGF